LRGFSGKRRIWRFLGRKPRKMTAHARRRMLLRRRRLNRRIVGTALIVLLTVGIAASALFLRLSAGPLDLNFADAVVRPGIQRLTGGNGSADFSRLELEWAEGRLRFRIVDFSVVRNDGKLIAQAPLAYVGFSILPLLSGNIEPATLEVRRPVLALTIESDGKVVMGGEAPNDKPKDTVPVFGRAAACPATIR
jgi:hypothetical protein